jgi:hypothetical protein
MSSPRDGHVAKPMDQSALKRRVDSGSCKYKSGLKNYICGGKWAGFLDKIIGGTRNQ